MNRVTKEYVTLLPEFRTIIDNNGEQWDSRICLDMKLNDSKSITPIIIIVMLNPGSCATEGQNVKWDSTLHRIKNILSSKVDWIRILNLSDIKCPKESNFFKLKDNFSEEHSIFNRKKDLDKYVADGQLVFFACGTNEKSKILLDQAKAALLDKKVGILNEAEPYFHPLVRPDNLKPKWESQINAAL